MRGMLNKLLARLIVYGELDVIWPDGTASHYAGEPGPTATIAIHDDATVRRLAFGPGMALGEGYMDGTITPVDCSIHDVLHVLMASVERAERDVPLLRAQAVFNRAARPLVQINDARKARRNVAHHYDLNGRLYSLFLDRDRQYSCGYFPRGDETIDEAQIAKKRHIAAKLMLDRPDLTVLDIGCGWGGMALTLARDYGARVTGITLSVEQLNEARSRAQAEGLAERVTFELMDYRNMNRTFDRIVSVGMFEHVGLPNYQAYFDTIKRCLHPDGVALVHAIGRFDGPAGTSPWLAKYIFPGGYSPSLSEVFGPVERSGLRSTDIEILRLHYAKTLNHWRKRFAANRDTIASLYDERFCRMFEFYLSGSELAFAVQDHMVFQLQLARRQDAVPLTRDYITETERKAARQTA
ncbi:SAM-dependent methyltransferase [Acidiphilium acidophilum]|uniref:Cyclopropane-fatty-acyl-phospholipid synthase family protein n=1 Tax=Acidiphilium acidophilum TaxID=76588 RepID=A0AAW9DM85_ACIAO|nr:cyclopropane-fatty-acyl-phospholipid synthase family protein [Acidiphilium acidophilum]MDX5930036.1 cyclopropane-fatty-acyl-phospholipid synthase family protein [Acidiphilium acidophilum]GBR74497.1 cyclopropane-fatty-acyl-phospholipid synthase [Acidiphilium acidophilum DSM 700]